MSHADVSMEDVGSTSGEKAPSDMDDDTGDDDSALPKFGVKDFIGEVINATKIHPSAPLWAKKSATNVKALYGRI